MIAASRVGGWERAANTAILLYDFEYAPAADEDATAQPVRFVGAFPYQKDVKEAPS